ncbi:ABC-three component system middle component 2 [Rhodophyticola porphyridii]|uniref:Threonine transporter n=1 Tax=Rhodophyticola porphyridii TaxID=1852017 RepID=A0A3L9XWA7_9RHOB|nr:ABC-three component system middle component 2 [Rhodophyticola porphyridii]RMA40894.1 threonine transporter [Rhodophyticola porphyridii]
MEKVDRLSPDLPFNGPLETGIRAVLNLYACFPKALDIQRLTALDYLIVRTSVLDGPPDLHPATPIVSPITQVRRKSVHAALRLMISRELVQQVATESGIFYRAGESSKFFVDALQSSYIRQLMNRASWLAKYSDQLDDQEFDKQMDQLLENWVSEFQDESGAAGSV